jgi:hypothetical protein
MCREEALVVREEKSRISKKALAKVRADLDTEWAKAEATQKEYLDKIEAHTTCAKHSLGLDKMLGERKVFLNRRERDLSLREAALAETQTRRLNSWDNHEELMEVVELRRLPQDAEVDRVAKVDRLAILVSDVSKVPVVLGMPPSWGFLRIHAKPAMSWRQPISS